MFVLVIGETNSTELHNSDAAGVPMLKVKECENQFLFGME